MKLLPDIIDYNLKVVFVGFNPSLHSAGIGYHYASRSNRFWKLLFLSGLTQERLHPSQVSEFLKYGYGSINIVDRPTKRADEITKEEYAEGRLLLQDKLIKYRPMIACYCGMGVYRELTQSKKVHLGIQEVSVVDGVIDYVCSSPSGLNSKPIEEQIECFKGLKGLIEKVEKEE